MGKETIRILHLYYDLMNLYGDWGNADILAQMLIARQRKTSIDKKSVGDDVDFGAYDFVYIGSGTERSQRACMQDLLRHKSAINEYIESGKTLLATGNSHELFGRAVTNAGGISYEALGVLEFETTQEHSRLTGDCVVSVSFLDDKLIGFINRAGGSQKPTQSQPDGGGANSSKGFSRPFRMDYGSYTDDNRAEGVMYKNLLGTYMTGPVLVRNPPLLRYYADLLTGEYAASSDGRSAGGRLEILFSSQELAYRMALGELSARR